MKGRKKKLKVPVSGIITIKTTFNNIIVSAANKQGDVVAWASAGTAGFSNAKKKNSPLAAQMTVTSLVNKLIQAGMTEVDVITSGIGIGKDTALRTIIALGMKILSISDRTPIPHNGCRPPKKKRN